MQKLILCITRTYRSRFLCLLSALFLSCNVGAGTSPYAETIIINGQVITADNDDPDEVTIAEAIAIRGDKILAVGSNAEIKALTADWTEVIDAKGNSVIPGLIDTHNHLYEHTLDFRDNRGRPRLNGHRKSVRRRLASQNYNCRVRRRAGQN